MNECQEPSLDRAICVASPKVWNSPPESVIATNTWQF